MTPEQELNLHIEQIGAFISASEDWANQYRKDDKTFQRLIKAERKLDTVTRTYFKDLNKRLLAGIDWSQYSALQAADFKVDVDIDWGNERDSMFNLFVDEFAGIQVIGATASEILYEREVGLSTSTKAIIKSAKEQAADMSKTVNETTIKHVREIIAKGISEGYDRDTVSGFLSTFINNPVRADLIAGTESVNAFGRGTLAYGQESGAATKTWEALPTSPDPEVCVGGETVPVDSAFSNGKLCPAGHAGCRCGLTLNYPDDV